MAAFGHQLKRGIVEHNVSLSGSSSRPVLGELDTFIETTVSKSRIVKRSHRIENLFG